MLTVIGFSLLTGLGFAGFTIGIALLTGNAAATQSGSFLFFPLTFLTATFVPLDLLSGRIKVAAQLNPITYVLDAMRSVMIDGWDSQRLLYGLLLVCSWGCSPLALACTVCGFARHANNLPIENP